MRLLRYILFVLLLPLAARSQTIHVDENRIVYKGFVPVSELDKGELFDKAKVALARHVKEKKDEWIEDKKDKGRLAIAGSLRLQTPHHLVRRVKFVFEISVEDGGFKYRIDSVYMIQRERGGEKEKIESEKMLKGVEITGPEAIDAEWQLNEIDMDYQKLIALIRRDVEVAALARANDHK